MKILIALVLMLALAASAIAEDDTNAVVAPPAVTSAAAEVPAADTNQPAATTPVEKPTEPATAEPSREALTTPAEEGVPLVASGEAEAWKRFEVGTRTTSAWLQEETKNRGEPGKKHFLGQLSKLDVEQDLAPYKVFADWFFLPCLGVELTWDELRAKAFNEPDPDGTSVSDGAWVISGPIVTVVGRYVNRSAWTPRVGMGAAFETADFEYAGWWHYGYNSPEQYAAAGSPKTFYKGKVRTIDPKDAVGFVVTGGCDARLNDRWLIDFYARYMAVSIDSPWTIAGQQKKSTVDLDNFVLGVGVAYAF